MKNIIEKFDKFEEAFCQFKNLITTLTNAMQFSTSELDAPVHLCDLQEIIDEKATKLSDDIDEISLALIDSGSCLGLLAARPAQRSSRQGGFTSLHPCQNSQSGVTKCDSHPELDSESIQINVNPYKNKEKAT